MKTIRLYQQDVNLKEADSKVLAVLRTEEECKAAGAKFVKDTQVVVLDKTIFFPEGGGQPCDLGLMENLKVLDVKEDKISGAVWHRTEMGDLPQTVHCKLDWTRRFDHMQMHCGEHVVSGLFHKYYKVENKGFHMGDDYMTIDMDPEEDSPVKEITEEMIRDIERKANQVIWDNLPVSTVYFETKEEANEKAPVRKYIKFDEDISVVFVGDPADPIDCCACCGTHVNTTGQIGFISIIKGEKYKGMLRLTLKAGRIALEDAIIKNRVSLSLCRRFSASKTEELEEKVENYEAKNAAARKELYDLKKDLLAGEAAKIESLQTEGTDVFRYENYSSADLQDLAHLLEHKTKGLVVLVGKDPSAILVSEGEPACGAIVKSVGGPLGAKGGGNPKLARAIFNDQESLSVFLKSI